MHITMVSHHQGRSYPGDDFYVSPFLWGSVQERSLNLAKRRFMDPSPFCKVRDGFSSFFSVFQGRYQKARIFIKIRRKNRPLPCKTATMNPLGSIIVVLQGWGTSLAQNPIKMAIHKNRPRDNYGPESSYHISIYVLHN